MDQNSEAVLSPVKQRLLRALRSPVKESAPISIAKRPVENDIPLSFPQERLWYFDQLNPTMRLTTYRLPFG